MKKSNPLPAKELLERLFRYEPSTGLLFWKKRSADLFAITAERSAEHSCAQWNSRWAGKEALTKVNKGYRCGIINYQPVLAHRVVWKLMTGEDPIEVDHIDGDRLNNRWKNLRNVTVKENRRNVARRSDNKSGATGVFWSAKHKQWLVVLSIGRFTELDEAVAARKAAEVLLGYHSNHGREAILMKET
jgi:hypothetical protein